jgi:hypothetical protein
MWTKSKLSSLNFLLIVFLLIVLYYNRFVLFLLQSYALYIAIQQLYAHSQLGQVYTKHIRYISISSFLLSGFDT